MKDKELFQKKYNQSRNNLLLMIILTVINIILLICNSNTMFLFSATIPYGFAMMGLFLDMPRLFTISIISVLIYIICWIFSKKHFGWFVPTLVLFIIDIIFWGYMTVDMAEGVNIIDILFHIWIAYHLFSGVYYGCKLKSFPPG